MLRKAQNRTLPTSPSSRGRRFCAQSRDKEFLANLARQFLDELNAKNIYKWNKLEDLYGISSSAFKATKYGSALLRRCNSSPITLLRIAYPEHKWLPWKFAHKPVSFWRSLDNQREYLDWLGKELKFTRMEDWYKITGKDFARNGGNSLLSLYEYSPSRVVTAVYSDHKWEQWKFTHQQLRWWRDENNIRTFFNALCTKYNIQSYEDMYKITSDMVIESGGKAIIARKGVAVLVTSLFPHHQWHIWRFERVPANWWASPENRMEYLQWLAAKLNYTKLEDWYQVTTLTIRKNYGTGLLDIYDNSVIEMLRANFPEHDWKPWKFLRVGGTWWNKMENQVAYCTWVMEQIGLSNMEDWYHVTVQQVINLHGRGILAKYGYSMYKMLSAVYPKHTWKSWAFDKSSKNVSLEDSESSQLHALKMLIEEMSERLGIGTELEKWYNVSSANLTFAEARILNRFGGLHNALMTVFPSHKWSFPPTPKRSAQHILISMLESAGLTGTKVPSDSSVNCKVS